MDSKRKGSRFVRLAVVSALVSPGALTVCPPVHAAKTFPSAWRSTCPDDERYGDGPISDIFS